MIQNIHQPNIANPLNKRLLILAEKTFEDLELWYTKLRLIEAGAEIVVAAPEKKEYQGLHGLTVNPDITIDEVQVKDYDGLIIPGGYAPDFLRRYSSVLNIVRQFNDDKKLVAFICHAGWVPASAGILKGKHVTGLIAIKDDLINAGAVWHDKPVVVDINLVSSRRPNDLPCFCNEIITLLQKES